MSVWAALYNGPWCHACLTNSGWQRGYGWGWWGSWWLWIVWVWVIIAVFWGGRTHGMRSIGDGTRDGRSGAEAVLKERYARGDLDVDTYRRMLEEVRR